jgi:hypothetical protein
MDLSGGKVFFRAFKPIENVEMEVSIPEIGLHFDYNVPLTREQSIEFTQLDTTAEKNTFIQKVVMSSTGIQRDINREIAERVKKKQ